MNHRTIFLLFLSAATAIFLALNPLTASAIDFPKPTGFVNDFVGILSSDDKSTLEKTLSDFEKTTSNEIVIAVVKSLEGLESFDYSQQLFTAWGVGKAKKNNGILFLIAPTERKAFINVGGGLEGAMPDSLTGSILRAEVVPSFKENNFADGIKKGLDAIMQATKGEYTAEEPQIEKESWFDKVLYYGFWGFLFFVFFWWMNHIMRSTQSWWFGAFPGAMAGLIVTVWISLYGPIGWTIMGIGAAVGLFYDYRVSKNALTYKKKWEEEKRSFSSSSDKKSRFWWFGGGGGGSSGGGFSGFGGGGSRGGGAGASW